MFNINFIQMLGSQCFNPLAPNNANILALVLKNKVIYIKYTFDIQNLGSCYFV